MDNQRPKNITGEMLKFKEASRHLWNAYFQQCVSVSPIAVQGSFEVIERELLRTIVLAPYDYSADADLYRGSPLPHITVKASRTLSDIPLNFGRADANGNIAWEPSVLVKKKDFKSGNFVEFFDWTPFEFVDCAYVRFTQPDEDRRVLIAQRYCEFFLDSGDIRRNPRAKAGGLG